MCKKSQFSIMKIYRFIYSQKLENTCKKTINLRGSVVLSWAPDLWPYVGSLCAHLATTQKFPSQKSLAPLVPPCFLDPLLHLVCLTHLLFVKFTVSSCTNNDEQFAPAAISTICNWCLFGNNWHQTRLWKINYYETILIERFIDGTLVLLYPLSIL